jgi:hypothetical protein
MADARSEGTPVVGDDGLARGVEHLQAAATELIAAARAFLDAAEDVVADPDRLRNMAEVMGDLARGASRAMAAARPVERAGAAGVEHIHVG